MSPTGQYQTLAQALDAVQDGWAIEIEAADYRGGAALAAIRKNNLTIRGVNGRPVFHADGMSTEGKAIWVVKGRDTTIENVEFTGAQVQDQNGAGIRLEGENLTLIGCSFHHNQMGILTLIDGGGRIVIYGSEFHHNGFGDGRSHNIYVNRASEFVLAFSSIHHAIVGHNVKSRASRNFILYNRIMDEADGNASYAVDLPNGGQSYLIGNLIQQGPLTENANIVAFGAEGLVWPTNTLYAVNNTIVNDRPSGGTFFRVFNGTVRATNNLLVGSGSLSNGSTFISANNISTTANILVNRAAYDYRLLSGSAAINAGVTPGLGDGVDLTPLFEYVHPLGSVQRPNLGPLDIGALEFRG